MSDLLQLMVSEGAADLHIRVNIPPVIRLHGILHRVEGPMLKAEDTEELMRSITSEDHIQQIREKGGADFGFAFGELARFRVSAFKEKGNFALVLRQIPSKLLTMEQIGIPPSARELLYRPRGLVLVKVIDTGIGLTADEQAHLFESFAQGEHATNGGTHRFGGLGLGLAISRMLVEMHSGHIRVTSAGRDCGSDRPFDLEECRFHQTRQTRSGRVRKRHGDGFREALHESGRPLVVAASA